MGLRGGTMESWSWGTWGVGQGFLFRFFYFLSFFFFLFFSFLFFRQGLALASWLECSPTTMACCSLNLWGPNNTPTSASQVPGTTGLHHHT